MVSQSLQGKLNLFI